MRGQELDGAEADGREERGLALNRSGQEVRKNLGWLAGRNRLVGRILEPPMVDDAQLESGGRFLGVTTDHLGGLAGERPAQSVDSAPRSSWGRLAAFGIHRLDPTDL